MRPGGGKAKGSAFEREVCKKLSLWVTDGERIDCFWRSAMSGGRATVKHGLVRQAGDICAVAPEGVSLADRFYIECKHVKNLALDSFLVKQTGPLAKFWTTATKEAAKHNRIPMLIAKQNGWPTIVVSRTKELTRWQSPILTNWNIDVTIFDDLLKAKYR